MNVKTIYYGFTTSINPMFGTNHGSSPVPYQLKPLTVPLYLTGTRLGEEVVGVRT